MIHTTREQRRQLERENMRWPGVMVRVPAEDMPPGRGGVAPIEAWRSRHFLAQVYQEAHGVLRVSVNRTEMGIDGRWLDGITWDELQRVKGEIGRGERFAVEVFPANRDVVDVANVRHLWILPAPLDFAWRVGA